MSGKIVTERSEGLFSIMSFDRDNRGGGRDRFGGGNDRFGGGQRGGFGGPRGGGGLGGGARSSGPGQVIGQGRGIVKFFNRDKGFGFIQREEGGDDAFVHISAVEAAGLATLAEGQTLEFQLVDRGGKISASELTIVGELVEPTERQSAPAQSPTNGEKVAGTVKFFNSSKGFGFITREDGQPDAFVHISAVERSGLYSLNEGDQLEFEIEIDRRGKAGAVNLRQR